MENPYENELSMYRGEDESIEDKIATKVVNKILVFIVGSLIGFFIVLKILEFVFG